MIRGLSISASGLAVNAQRLTASAHNTANLTSEETARVRVRAQEIPGSGVLARHSVGGEDTTVVDEAVEQLLAGHHFTASLRAVQAQDEMLGMLIDVRG